MSSIKRPIDYSERSGHDRLRRPKRINADVGCREAPKDPILSRRNVVVAAVAGVLLIGGKCACDEISEYLDQREADKKEQEQARKNAERPLEEIEIKVRVGVDKNGMSVFPEPVIINDLTVPVMVKKWGKEVEEQQPKTYIARFIVKEIEDAGQGFYAAHPDQVLIMIYDSESNTLVATYQPAKDIVADEGEPRPNTIKAILKSSIYDSESEWITVTPPPRHL